MKQKYVILRDEDQKALIIKEYAELDKEIFSLLCEETYKDAVIRSAKKKGVEALVEVLRTENLYPPALFVENIAESVMAVYDSKTTPPVELLFNDIDFVTKTREKPKIEEIETDASDLDDILDDSYEDIYDEKESLNNINSPIKVADDETLDIDEEP
ncbi:hypothetical protein ACFL9U_01535 [Thermodesulfobacteriota bacterium]